MRSAIHLLDDQTSEINLRPHERLGNAGGRFAGLVTFLLTTGLAYPMSSGNRPAYWTAVVGVLASMAMFPVLPLRRFPRWAEAVPPMFTLMMLVLFVGATGGFPGGFGIALLGPLMWFSIFGSGVEVAVAIATVAIASAVPVFSPVFPALADPPSVRVLAAWVLMFALVALLVHEIVREYLLQIHRVESARRTVALSHQALVHDMKGPLGVTSSMLDDLRTSIEDGDVDSSRGLIDAISTGVDQSLLLVDDVLTLHDVQDPGGRSQFDPAEVIRVAASTVPGIEVSLDDVPLRIDGYRSALARAFRNLFENASKYAGKRDGSAVRIRVSAHRMPAGWSFRVRDDGPGFSDRDIPHVFEPFRRGSTRHGEPGHGLGLSIVRACAEAHDGTVSATNDPAGGACITMTIATGGSGA